MTDTTGKPLAGELRELASALGERMASTVGDRVGGLTERLNTYAERGGDPNALAMTAGVKKLTEGRSPLRAAVSAGIAGGRAKLRKALGGGKGGKGDKTKIKLTNIVESVDVGVPVRVAYDQWTRFSDFPSFMKKVENVDVTSAEKSTWKAQIFWSHRTWESTVVEQIPDRHIVWRSTGDKGHVDGTVSFHELAPNLTRILVVLAYHPQGLFERTGNLWRAQGRRVRLELKHFVRHVMSRPLPSPDELRGWRGEIRDGRVVPEETATSRRRRAEPEKRRTAPDERSRPPARRARTETRRRADSEV